MVYQHFSVDFYGKISRVNVPIVPWEFIKKKDRFEKNLPLKHI